MPPILKQITQHFCLAIEQIFDYNNLVVYTIELCEESDCMAIVFDTQAELEAFCEAFELRIIQKERPLRKARRKFSQIEQATDIPEPMILEPETPQRLHMVPVTEPETAESEVMDEPPVLFASAS
jgi:hypothetical protein